MSVPAIRIAELSSRYDRSPESLLAQITKAAKTCDIILLTEVNEQHRRAVLDDLPGWTLHQGAPVSNGAEVAVITRDGVWTAKHFEAIQTAPDLPGPGGRTITAAVVLRRNRGGKTLAVSITHTPAGVEAHWDSPRASEYRKCIRRVRDLHARLRKDFKPDAEAAFADWNLNLHKPWVQAWIKSAWPSLTVSSLIPKGATHAGGRLIDWFVKRGWKVASWTIFDQGDASDHDGIRVTGSFLPRKVKPVTVAPPAPPFIAARHKGDYQVPRAIVIHGTVSHDDPGTARQIAYWWHGPSSPQTSAHYIVDPKETIQCVGDHAVAFHCGHNTGSIGVELCDEQTGPANRWDDADSQAILARSARLVAQLCAAYGIEPRRPSIADLKAKGPHGIYGHNDSRLAFGNTNHSDPRDFPWGHWLELVRIEHARLTGGTR